MRVNNRQILNLLVSYRDSLIKLLEVDRENITVASEYSFVTVNITQDDEQRTYIRFTVSETAASLESIYSDDKSAESDFQKKIEGQRWPGLRAVSTQTSWSNGITHQLETADNIAGLATDCTVGDEYGPGNFSKILLDDTHIELQQVNYMNAKSLDHKDDYSLRSLVFRIPLDETNKMTTEFTDRSSRNNRPCGDRIKAALDWTP